MIKRTIKRLLWIIFKYDPWTSVLRVSYGNRFPEDRILLIQRNDPRTGFFSFFLTKLGWIGYAFKNGMRPVVDMEYFRNIYQGKHCRNSWDLFFCQPDGIALHEAHAAKDVTIVRDIPADYPNLGMGFFNNVNGSLDYWRNIYQRYIKFQDGILDDYQNPEFEDAIAKSKVLGVMVRGTDYLALKPKGHPVQPSTSEMFIKIDEMFRSGDGFDRLFLVTEDDGVKDEFRRHYADKLILSKQDGVRYAGGYLSENKKVAGNTERTLRYIRAIYDLSRCHYIVAGRTSGSVAAVLMRRPNQRHFVFDLGTY